MNRKEDTPQRIIRRKYEEKHKDERQAAHKVWGTSVDRSLANEIDDFLIKHRKLIGTQTLHFPFFNHHILIYFSD